MACTPEYTKPSSNTLPPGKDSWNTRKRDHDDVAKTKDQRAERKKLFHTKSNTKFHSHLLTRQEEVASKAQEITRRTEDLLQEESGFIAADDESHDISRLTQHEIKDAVDITSAHKFFELDLRQFGPYRINYTRNGRFLLLGGRKGHTAAFDWQTKRLLCEMNVMERINDVRWLHQETLFAVAQRQWTYVYDNQGIELHCLKNLDRVLRLEFLPYHFLLVSSNCTGYLTYLDVCVGQKVAGFSTHMGRLDVMCQNPSNAVVCLGHSGGTVTMWSPNINEPLVKILCHGGGVRSVAVDKTGRYMATSGMDRCLKIWDLRTYKLFNSYRIRAGASHLSFSQTGYLAAAIGNITEVYERINEQVVTKPYLSHVCNLPIHSLQFCPYEDVLGVGHATGFTSLIVPGTGEPNFDAMESNPYQTKKQRREMEVKQLLEKIQPEMITLNSAILGQVERKAAEEIHLKRQKELKYSREKVHFKPKNRAKGGSKPTKVQNRIRAMQDLRDRKLRRGKVASAEKQTNEGTSTDVAEFNVLSRFKRHDV